MTVKPKSSSYATMVLDLSHHNDVNSWDDIARSGILGIIHKATEGSSYVDDTYVSRQPQAEAAGLLWGAYHFLRPGDMRQQARHFVDTAGDNLDLYAADHEDEGVSLDDLKDFLAEVEILTGKTPIIYSGNVLKDQVGIDPDPGLSEYRLWLAHYTDEPSWPTQIWPKWWLWQYTDQGAVDGVSGGIDCNRYDGTQNELIDDWTGKEVEPLPPPAPEPPPQEVEIRLTISIKIVMPEGITLAVGAS